MKLVSLIVFLVSLSLVAKADLSVEEIHAIRAEIQDAMKKGVTETEAWFGVGTDAASKKSMKIDRARNILTDWGIHNVDQISEGTMEKLIKSSYNVKDKAVDLSEWNKLAATKNLNLNQMQAAFQKAKIKKALKLAKGLSFVGLGMAAGGAGAEELVKIENSSAVKINDTTSFEDFGKTESKSKTPGIQ